jgi:hypothetical protein
MCSIWLQKSKGPTTNTLFGHIHRILADSPGQYKFTTRQIGNQINKYFILETITPCAFTTFRFLEIGQMLQLITFVATIMPTTVRTLIGNWPAVRAVHGVRLTAFSFRKGNIVPTTLREDFCRPSYI